LNFNFFLLPTKFLQPVNLAILTIWSLFTPIAVPAAHLLSPFLTHQPYPHWKSQIIYSDMHHLVSGIYSLKLIHSVSLANHVSTHLLIHLSAHLYYHHHSRPPGHHSFTFSLQAQNLPFQQILPTLDLFYLLDCLHDNGTELDLSRSSLYFYLYILILFVCSVWWTKLATGYTRQLFTAR